MPFLFPNRRPFDRAGGWAFFDRFGKAGGRHEGKAHTASTRSGAVGANTPCPRELPASHAGFGTEGVPGLQGPARLLCMPPVRAHHGAGVYEFL